MAKVYAFLADGLEEVECLAVVDVLRRSGIETVLVSVSGKQEITGSHGIRLMADVLFEEADPDQADILFLPGGMPGTKNLQAHRGLLGAMEKAARQGRRIAAICAAPSIFGHRGYLKGRRATSYPSFESHLEGAQVTHAPAETDGNVITGRGMGCSIPFALAVVEYLSGKEEADRVADSIVFPG